jgi:hypothetical protein
MIIPVVLMSADLKKSTSATAIFVILGIAALFCGAQWLTVLIPAAILVWYGAGSTHRTGRN